VLRQHVDDLAMPTAVLSEGVLSRHPGRDSHVRRLLELLDVAPVDEKLGHAAGDLRVRARRDGSGPAPSGVDAIVAAFAYERASTDDVLIVTSDADDITALAVHSENAERLTIRSV